MQGTTISNTEYKLLSYASSLTGIFLKKFLFGVAYNMVNSVPFLIYIKTKIWKIAIHQYSEKGIFLNGHSEISVATPDARNTIDNLLFKTFS